MFEVCQVLDIRRRDESKPVAYKQSWIKSMYECQVEYIDRSQYPLGTDPSDDVMITSKFTWVPLSWASERFTPHLNEFAQRKKLNLKAILEEEAEFKKQVMGQGGSRGNSLSWRRDVGFEMLFCITLSKSISITTIFVLQSCYLKGE